MSILSSVKNYVKRTVIALILVIALATSAVATQASWYGPGFHGRLTASGERFNQNELTAAHKSLPFGTVVKVTNNRNGKDVTVRINDRGPFVKGRVIDLSKAAHLAIDCNVCNVTLDILEMGSGKVQHIFSGKRKSGFTKKYKTKRIYKRNVRLRRR